MNRLRIIRDAAARVFERSLVSIEPGKRTGKPLLAQPPPFFLLDDYYLDRTLHKVTDTIVRA